MAKPRNVRFIVRPHRGEDRAIDPGVGDRVRAEMILACLEELAREFTVQGGWDQPPSLGFLYQRSRTPAGQTEHLGPLQYSRMELEYKPLAEATPAMMQAMRQGARPHHVVVGLVENLRSLGVDAVQAITPPSLIAVVMHTEAWMIMENLNADDKKREEIRKASEDRKIHEHPDRVETRQVLAVDVDYIRYAVMQERAGKMRHLVGTGAAATGMSGDVPNSLEYFMWLIQGRDPGDWKTWWQTHFDYREKAEKLRQEADEERRRKEAG